MLYEVGTLWKLNPQVDSLYIFQLKINSLKLKSTHHFVASTVSFMIRWMVMNDTNLNTRQQRILAFLADNPKKSRGEIKNALFAQNKISKITLVRDINQLIAVGFVVVEGSGRYVKYSVTSRYALLYPISLDEYYEMPTDKRALKYDSFNFGVFNILTDLLDDAEKMVFTQGREKLKNNFALLDPTILKKELERFIVELSWKSSQIEGNTYSLLETEELIKNKREAKGHDKSEAVMILNHKYAFDTILEHKNDYKKISLHDLRSLHSILIKDLDITSGVRKQKVGITGTKYTPLDNKQQIDEALEKLFELLNNINFVPESALILLAMISYIQPFADGNKRTARMISNAVLLANDYYPLSYRSVDEVEFKKALLIFYEQNNLYHLKRIFISQQEFAIANYFGR